MPRSNNSPSDTPARPRSRGPVRSTSPRSTSYDAATDRSPSSANSGTTPGGNDGPTYDEIAEAAYQRYLRRGGGDGQDFDDWVEAERELRSRRSSQ